MFASHRKLDFFRPISIDELPELHFDSNSELESLQAHAERILRPFGEWDVSEVLQLSLPTERLSLELVGRFTLVVYELQLLFLGLFQHLLTELGFGREHVDSIIVAVRRVLRTGWVVDSNREHIGYLGALQMKHLF